MFCHSKPTLKKQCIYRSLRGVSMYLRTITPRIPKLSVQWLLTLVTSSTTQASSITSFSASLRAKPRVWTLNRELCCRPHTKHSRIRDMFRMQLQHSNRILLVATSVWPQTTMYRTCEIRSMFTTALVCPSLSSLSFPLLNSIVCRYIEGVLEWTNFICHEVERSFYSYGHGVLFLLHLSLPSMPSLGKW